MIDLQIKAAANVAEVLLYGEIGGEHINADRFAKELRKAGTLHRINLRINSPGGDVFEGLTIFNTLRQHPAKVHVDIDGLAASIASVIAMSGDEVRMAENSLMMIHDPWTIAMGTADDFTELAKTLNKIKQALVGVYASKTKLPTEQLEAMMSAETWLSASEAKAHNFIDGITPNSDVVANFDCSRFRNAPRKQEPAASSSSPHVAWRLAAALRELTLINK